MLLKSANIDVFEEYFPAEREEEEGEEEEEVQLSYDLPPYRSANLATMRDPATHRRSANLAAMRDPATRFRSANLATMRDPATHCRLATVTLLPLETWLPPAGQLIWLL